MTWPSSEGGLTFGLLGPLTVARDGAEVAVPRGRPRLLLARLLIDAGRVVPAERLLDEIWGPIRPATGTGPVRTNVWELRRLLAHGDATNGGQDDDRAVLVTRGRGYVLDVDPESIDSRAFERRLADAGAFASGRQLERALRSLDDALRLHRGPSFGDLAGELPVHLEAERLDQVVLRARELRAELLVATGAHRQAAAELQALARANPERERLWALLMVSLYRSGRQAEALRRYNDARAGLRSGFGIEPGPELRALEQAILQQDPSLHGDWMPPEPDDRRSPVVGRRHSVATTRPGPAPPETTSEHCGHVDRAPASGAHDLPVPSTSLVGRRAERRAVAQALDRSRVVTLVGAGGCGKTRLAVAVAHDVRQRFPGGTRFVDLSTVRSPDVVPQVAPLLTRDGGEPHTRAGPGGSARRAGGAERPMLLVLDSCEHVAAAIAREVSRALDRMPSLRILATSRQALRLDKELVWRVPALSLSDPGVDEPGRRSEAVELFVQRAGAVLPGFAPGGATLELVDRICHELDGLPLAIERAATLVGSLPLPTIASRLDRRLGLLDDCTADATRS